MARKDHKEPDDEPLKDEESDTSSDETISPESELETLSIDEGTQEEDKEEKKEPSEKPKKAAPAFFRTKKRTTLSIVVGVIVLLAILVAIPVTRYFILGWVIKKDVTVTVLDSTTKRPVSDATITLDGKKATSDKNGNVEVSAVPVSSSKLVVTKQYYKTQSQPYTVPVFSNPKKLTLSLVATGRQVTIELINTISNEPIQGAKISASGTNTVTDKEGVGIIILPADKSTQTAVISASGYNTATETINVNSSAVSNDYTLTPSGTIYYLSNITGTTNVMKSNLDGTGSSIVVPGTGYENNQSVLLATEDWQYMALQSIRQSDGLSRIYMIDSKTNTLKIIDQSGASYQLIGWSGHNFMYEDIKSVPNQWTSGQYVIKSYDADSGTTTVIDQSVALGSDQSGFQSQYFNAFYIIGKELFYEREWNFGGGFQYQDTGQSIAFVTSDVYGNKKVLKDISDQYDTYSGAIEYAPGDIYIQVNTGSSITYYEFEDGSFTTSNITSTQFSDSYPTYLFSPSGNKTLWYEVRNGSNTLFIGDDDAQNPQTIATLSDFTPYGWYGDNYIILSKGGNELYIASADKILSTSYQGIEITSYQSSQNSYRGYGSGYGGQL